MSHKVRLPSWRFLSPDIQYPSSPISPGNIQMDHSSVALVLAYHFKKVEESLSSPTSKLTKRACTGLRSLYPFHPTWASPHLSSSTFMVSSSESVETYTVHVHVHVHVYLFTANQCIH